MGNIEIVRSTCVYPGVIRNSIRFRGDDHEENQMRDGKPQGSALFPVMQIQEFQERAGT